MPKNIRKPGSRKNRRDSRPNVYAQSQVPQDDDDDIEVESTTSTSAAPAPRRAKARVERTTRRAGVRSEIYTRSLPAELKKLGMLSGGIIAVLVVLTFVL